jgi:hypothetical protein
VPHHEIPPRAFAANKPMLYFVHDLPIWGESLIQYVDRIVLEQSGVGAKRIRVIDLTMNLYEDSQQWALTRYLLVEVDKLPVPGNYGNQVTEVATFTEQTIPDEFGWYEKKEIDGLIKSTEASG